MEGMAYAAALALALVFATAGITKLRRRSATARAFASLGLASPGALAVGVPVAELGLATGLVVVPEWTGIVALAVLAGFTTFVVRAVRRGERQGCGCFGTARPAPMGAAEVVRNGWLALGATLAAFSSGPVVPHPLALMAVAGMAAAGAASVAAVAHRRPPTLGSRQGPPPGSPAPALPGLHRDRARTTLLAFVAPACEGCAQLRATLERLSLPDLAVQVVDLDDRSASFFAAFDVVAPPFVVVIDSRGVVRASGPARSVSDIDRLIA